MLAKAQFHWYLNTNLWLLQDCFDFESWALTARCPSVMETVAQMSRFKGSGPGAGGVLKWNLPPWGPGDFVWEHVCTAAACKDRPASGPYINHHMSSSLNKMEHLLCFLWTQLQQISLGSSSSLAVLIGSSVSGFLIPYFSLQQVCENMGGKCLPCMELLYLHIQDESLIQERNSRCLRVSLSSSDSEVKESDHPVTAP